MDTVSQVRIAAASPIFQERAKALDALLQKQGVDFRWTDVVRSSLQQAADWNVGRDLAGRAIGKTITNAPPGKSWHEFRFAGDGCPMVNGEPDWNVDGENWQKVYAALPRRGFISGREFKTFRGDDDHVQLVEIPESPTAEDTQFLLDGNLHAVTDKYFPPSGGKAISA